jgi:hypothetical protein
MGTLTVQPELDQPSPAKANAVRAQPLCYCVLAKAAFLMTSFGVA